MISTIFALFAIIIFVLQLRLNAAYERLPALETFSSYEDMQRYFDNRNFRSLRLIDNPTQDTYLNAFNHYNEQPIARMDSRSTRRRIKRSNVARKLPTEPRLLKFEIEDAVEPSAEVKALLRKHLKHEEPTSGALTAEAVMSRTMAASTEATKIATRKPRLRKVKRRQKRATQVPREPANFKFQLIPFEVSDAREPDEPTKQLIKRLRAIDLEKEQTKLKQPTVAGTRVTRNSAASSTTSNPQPNLGNVLPLGIMSVNAVPITPAVRLNPYKLRIRKMKRSKRAAPEMIKFELADAREPTEQLKAMLQQNRESKSLNSTEPIPTNQTLITTLVSTTPTALTNSKAEARSDIEIDQNSNESKRMYIFKEAPMKVKKSIRNVPHEVQKVISHLIKDHQSGKAYIKHIPSQKMDYEHLKNYYSSKTQPAQQVYGLKLHPATFVKYVPVAPKPEVQIQSVPVVEKLRYVYTPATHVVHTYSPAPKYVAAPAPIAVQQPIVVQEAAPQPEVHHHTYAAAEIKPPPQPVNVEVKEVLKEIPAPPFRPSKPDPLLEENKLPDPTSFIKSNFGIAHIKPIEQYKYEIYSYQSEPHTDNQPQSIHHLQQEPQPVIKIEYHAPPDPVKENFKDLPEFKELSALIGKSPDDQIHGLTYLLAKEMQNKLHRQPKSERPQDSTAPILFHPGEANSKAQQQQPQVVLGIQPGRLIGMGKTKQYIPIIEQSNEGKAEEAATENTHEAAEQVKYVAVKTKELKVPTPNSYVEYGHGLSSGYEGLNDGKQAELTKHIIYHPTVTHQGSLEDAGHVGEEHASQAVHYNINHQEDNKLQYASKYAFGYRIRDFLTGNDFGHKQNRDLNGVTHGQYHILLPDGRIQNVIYHADDTGFHADVSFETGKH